MTTISKPTLLAKLADATKAVEAPIMKRLDSATKEDQETIITEAFNAGNEARKDVLIKLFNKDVSSHSSNSFIVYCQTWEERTEVFEMVKSMGFVNVQTYEPLMGGKDEETVKDPRGNFAVEVKDSVELIFGNYTEQFMNMFEAVVGIVKEQVIYTYAYNTDYALLFNDKAVAELLYASLETMINEVKQGAKLMGKEIPDISVKFKQERLDSWRVHICAKI